MYTFYLSYLHLNKLCNIVKIIDSEDLTETTLPTFQINQIPLALDASTFIH